MRPGTGERPLSGALVAAVTAVVSGVSIFVNSYGVHALASAAAYTTAKNLVAALLLGGGTLVATRARPVRRLPSTRRWVERPQPAPGAPDDRPRRVVAQWIALAYVGVVGGGIAFVLFFDGLAETAATPAAFLHDGLVVWVALLAGLLLHERLHLRNLVAIVLLMAGQVAVLGGVGRLAMNRGDLLVLGATVLWAVEVVACRRLLAALAPATVSLTRMGVGTVVLLGYLGATGSLPVLGSLSGSQLGWIVLTGVLLAAYVATWMTALSRARAVDVTSVLVGSTVITSVLVALGGTLPVPPAAAGLLFITVGVGILVWTAARRAPA